MNIQQIRPNELINDFLFRLGNPTGDGGYAVPYNVMKQSDILYSYGVGDNSTFENHYTSITGKPAHLYDHTVEGSQSGYGNHTFHKEGLSGLDEGITNNFILYNLSIVMKTEIEKAKELLQANGYYVGGLWHIADIQNNYECSDCIAEFILAKAIQNELVYDQIWSSINDTACFLKLKNYSR